MNKFLHCESFENYQRNKKSDHHVAHVYLGKILSEKLVRVTASRICCTSKLLFGDLSQHKKISSRCTAVKLYDDYSAFLKLIQKSSTNFTIVNNLTQGVIEQHFNIIKKPYT